jgi:hypothetical protein
MASIRSDSVDKEMVMVIVIPLSIRMPVGRIRLVLFSIVGERRDIWCAIRAFGEALIKLKQLLMDLFHYPNIRRVTNVISCNKQAERFPDWLIGKINKVR